MNYSLIMALGAGAASAVLFILPMNGTLPAMALGVFAPLPMLIAGLGAGERVVAIAAAVGAGVIALALHPAVAGFFLISVALPAYVLSGLARRERLGSPGLLLLTIAGVATLLSWVGVAVEVWRHASAQAAFDSLVEQLTPMAASVIDSSEFTAGEFNPREFATWVALGMAPVAAAWGVAGLSLNLWLAARVSAISGQLPRSWPDIPSTLRLPRLAFAIFGVALLACAPSGLPRLLAATAVAALAAACAEQGLARLHSMTRGRPGRPAILGGFYVLSLALFPWTLVLAAGLGLADVARPRPVAGPLNSTKPSV